MSRIKIALDFCLSRRLVGVLNELYSHNDYEFLHLETIANGTDSDITWADKYKKFGGVFVISGDCKIAYKPHEAIAFIENGLVSVFPTENWCSLKLNAHAAVISYYWPTIIEKFKNAPKGSCWSLPLSVKKHVITLCPTSLRPLEIPNDVLQKAKLQRSADSKPSKNFA